MTDYYDVPTIYTGDWIDAAWLNQYVGDNFRAFKQGFVNAGDIAYAVDGNTLGALAKPASVDGFFKMSQTGVPEYIPKTQLPGALHTKGQVFHDSVRSTSSASFVDVTGFAFNLTLTATCTIVAKAFGICYTNNGVQYPTFAINIDGTDDPNPAEVHRSAASGFFMTEYVKSIVLAGTRTVKLRYKVPSGDVVNTGAIKLEAFAFVE